MRTIAFSIHELNMIFEDQKNTLENIHYRLPAPAGECALQDCPPEHFGDEDIEDIFMRQEIMKKILADANET